jgi:phage terminase large subunit-like protein
MEAVVNKFRTLTPKQAIVGQEWGKAFDRTRRVLRFEHGATIDFMSTEQDPDKFGGVDLHRVHYDEEPDGPNVETIWQESRWRLLDHGGDTVLTMTPLFGVSSLVHDRVWDRRKDPGIFAIQASVWDNPHIDPQEISEALEGMTEEEKRARVYGEFVHFAGLFFDEFQITRHVPEKIPTPQDLKTWDVIVGIDPGLERSAVTWVAFDGENHALVFAELYPHDTLIPEIADQIRAKNLEWGIEPTYYVIDPAARIRGQVSREMIQSAYEREGIPTIYGQNERGPGILEMKRRLQQDALHISPDCANLIWEFGRYRKDPNSRNEFDAIKKDDHLLDSLRYVCMERPWGPIGPGRGDPEPFHFQGEMAPRWDQLEVAGAASGPPIPS